MKEKKDDDVKEKEEVGNVITMTAYRTAVVGWGGGIEMETAVCWSATCQNQERLENFSVILI